MRFFHPVSVDLNAANTSDESLSCTGISPSLGACLTLSLASADLLMDGAQVGQMHAQFGEFGGQLVDGHRGCLGGVVGHVIPR